MVGATPKAFATVSIFNVNVKRPHIMFSSLLATMFLSILFFLDTLKEAKKKLQCRLLSTRKQNIQGHKEGNFCFLMFAER